MSFGQRKLDREKPEIDFPEGDAPTELVIQDLIEGKGAEVVPGSRVLAHYVGVAFSTGEEFDASWNRGEPLPFQVGVGQVIRGWDEGLLGMKVGGVASKFLQAWPTVTTAQDRSLNLVSP